MEYVRKFPNMLTQRNNKFIKEEIHMRTHNMMQCMKLNIENMFLQNKNIKKYIW